VFSKECSLMNSRACTYAVFSILFCCPAVLPAQPPGNFTATNSMSAARSFHTATLLLDGRVLIAGGGPGISPLATTEIYDPITQTFTPAGNMTTPRYGHTATLLADGRVLIVGGDSAGVSAELYDPSTANFTATGNLQTARSNEFNATLLANGKVLITGGVASQTQNGDIIGDAELYDPSTGVFTSAGTYAGSLAGLDPNVFSFGSTSTMLPDGTVLFASEPNAQVYDPVSSSFSLKGAIAITSEFGTTVTPDYVVDRTANLLLSGKVLAAGGEQEDLGRFNDAQLYDPASGVFVPTGSMAKARSEHSATLLPDGTVLVAGGESDTCSSSGGSEGCFFSGTESSAELYVPVKGAFTGAGNMTAPREWHTATLLNSGDVLITGGVASENAGYGATTSAELYHPALPYSPPALFSLTGNGSGQGAVWHPTTGQLASPQIPATADEILSMYVSGLAEGGAIPPQVAVDGRMAQVLYFGDAPGYPGYFQVNFEVPPVTRPGSAVPVRLMYLNRSSNTVTIAVQ
jgi:hypothetical protein